MSKRSRLLFLAAHSRHPDKSLTILSYHARDGQQQRASAAISPGGCAGRLMPSSGARQGRPRVSIFPSTDAARSQAPGSHPLPPLCRPTQRTPSTSEASPTSTRREIRWRQPVAFPRTDLCGFVPTKRRAGEARSERLGPDSAGIAPAPNFRSASALKIQVLCIWSVHGAVLRTTRPFGRFPPLAGPRSHAPHGAAARLRPSGVDR